MRTIFAVAAAAIIGASALAADKAPEEAMDFANSVASATAFEIQSSQLAQKNAKSAGDFKVAPKESMGVKHLANYELERAPQH